MIEEMMRGFLGSSQGQGAMQALMGQGFDPQQAQTLLGHATDAATQSLQNQTAGAQQPQVGLFNIFGGHAGREALLGAVSGMMRGDGFFGSLEDGALGVLVGHIGEYIGSRMGMDPAQAGQIAALLTPYIGSYVHEHLQQNHRGLLASIFG